MDEGTEDFRELAAELMNLGVHVGLMTSVSDHWPPHVQEAWLERVRGMRHWCLTTIDEVQMFAQAYDKE